MKQNIMVLKDVKDIYNAVPRGFKRKMIFQLIYNQLIKENHKLDNKNIEESIDSFVETNKLDYKNFTIETLKKAICDEDVVNKSIKDLGIRKKGVADQIIKLCSDSKNINEILYKKITDKCNIKDGSLYISYNIDKFDIYLFLNRKVEHFKLDSTIFISDKKTQYYDDLRDIYYKFNNVNSDIDRELSIDIKDYSQFIYYFKHYIKYILEFINKFIENSNNINYIYIHKPNYFVNIETLEIDLDLEIKFINFFESDFKNFFINSSIFKYSNIYYEFYEIVTIKDNKISLNVKEDNSIEELYKKSQYNLLLDFIESELSNIKKTI